MVLGPLILEMSLSMCNVSVNKIYLAEVALLPTNRLMGMYLVGVALMTRATIINCIFLRVQHSWN